MIDTNGAEDAEAKVPPAQPTREPPVGKIFGNDPAATPVCFQAIGRTTPFTVPFQEGRSGEGPNIVLNVDAVPVA